MNGSALWLEDKYAGLVGSRLQRFSKRDANTYNFRCPFCGDSEKSKFKARGYFYHKKGRVFFKCHNCGRGMTLSTFIKEIDSTLYKEFRLEVLKESNSSRVPKGKEPEIEKSTTTFEYRPDVLSGLKHVDHFDDGHPVNSYVKHRRLPKEDLWYADRFMEWVNTKIPEKFDKNQLKMDEPRLVIPFRDKDGRVFAVTGRSFKSKGVKYLTIKFDEDQNKVFGMDRVDQNRRVYIVEGPIDSYFLDNCIAFAGSSGTIPRFKDHVVILDNEPRNREIIRLIEKMISAGHPVCIWPDSFEYKDVNEAIVAGMTSDEVKKIIDNNTYVGLKAKVRLNAYRRS